MNRVARGIERELLAPLVERVRRHAVALVGEQLLDELVARVGGVEIQILHRRGRVARFAGALVLEHAGLDLHQRGGHDEELARQVNVDLLDLLEKRQVLIRDGGDGDVGDVHLRPADEEQQQVQRTLEGVERNVIVILEGHA